MICVIKLTDGRLDVSIDDNIKFKLKRRDAEDLRNILNVLIGREDDDDDGETKNNH